MIHYKYKSLEQFYNQFPWDKQSNNSLLVTDIDAVFFKGLHDPREWFGLISQKKLNTFRKILQKIQACWVFSNRLKFLKFQPFVKQLAQMIKETTTTTPNIYTDCSDFLNTRLQNYIIIINAKKPGQTSQKVVERGIENFDSVIYIGGNDLILPFSDRILVQRLEKQADSTKLIFIEILPIFHFLSSTG